METSKLNVPYPQQLNLMQEPIRVEMLTSPFAQPVFYDEFHGIVRHFVGVNAEIIKVLTTVMNFSGKYCCV